MFTCRMGFIKKYVGVTIVYFGLFQVTLVIPFFENYKLARAYNEHDFDKAHAVGLSQLIDRPHDSQILYNCGDIAYRRLEFDQAKTYFKQAVSQISAENHLYKKSWFNHGNCCMHRKEFKEAIESYDRILEIDPEDERALYNKSKAEGLLKKEEYQKHDNPDSEDGREDQQEKQQNKDQKQDQKDSADKDQENSPESESENSDDEKQQQGQQRKESSPESNSRKQSGKQDGSQHTPKESPQDHQKDEQQGDQQKDDNEGQGNNEEHKNENRRQDPGQYSNDHINSPDSDETNQKSDSQKAGKPTQEGKQSKKSVLRAVESTETKSDEPLDRAAHLLEQIDKEDKESGKYLFKLRTRDLNHEGTGHKNW